MCRWFVYYSPTEPCLLSDVLITPTNSITQQISKHYLPGLLPHEKDHDLNNAADKLIKARNSILNMDGIGVAWYTPSQANFISGVDGQRPALYKSPNPLMNDFNFRSICSNTESTCVFAHIRASSGAPAVSVNCHPFVFGRYTFMHNGVVSDFLDIKRQLSLTYSKDEYSNIHGSTDSEHLAALFMHNLTSGSDEVSWDETFGEEAMAQALTKTVTDICELQLKLLGRKARPNSLNLAVTDGSKLCAVRFRNHKSQEPPSLYVSETAGITLNSKYPGHPNKGAHNRRPSKTAAEHGKHVILASEPTTEISVEGEWKLIPRNSLVRVSEDGRWSTTPIEYDGRLDACDPSVGETAQVENPRSPLQALAGWLQ